MQIAIIKTEPSKKPKPSKEVDPSKLKKFHVKVKDAYKVFKSEKEAEDYFKTNGALWATYGAADFGVTKMADFSDGQKKSFEFFVCGWVQYYDEITRNNAIKHILYFKWNPQTVRVHICPKPGDDRKPISPPSPTTDPKSPTAPPPPYP